MPKSDTNDVKTIVNANSITYSSRIAASAEQSENVKLNKEMKIGGQDLQHKRRIWEAAALLFFNSMSHETRRTKLGKHYVILCV